MIANNKLNSFQLKVIALIAMLLDHIAIAFLSNETFLYQLMRLIGRVSMPIMCYFIAEGYHKTSNLKKYILRLILFAVVSHIPFVLFILSLIGIPWTYCFSSVMFMQTSAIFTLFLALLTLVIYYHKKMNKFFKCILILCICLVSQFSDWRYVAILWVLIFGTKYRENNKKYLYFSIISILYIFISFLKLCFYEFSFLNIVYYFGILAAIPLLYLYDGSLGKVELRWLFYIFYPLHLLVISILKYLFR